MTNFKLCTLLLLSSVLTSGCGGGRAALYVAKHPEISADKVIINNCDANPDLVDVYAGQTLTWTVASTDPDTYIIAFGDNRPISPKSSTASNSSPNAQNIQKDFWCKCLGWVSSAHCKYDYTLTKRGSPTQCPDPGVHILR